VGDISAVAEKVALGALHYYLLSVSPSKDMLFNPKESLSFNGNTGPYLQYMGARISALLRKAEEAPKLSGARGSRSGSLLVSDPEWELLKVLAGYGDALSAAAEGRDPSLVGTYLYDLSKAFSRFYHDCPVLSAENTGLVSDRLALSRAVLRVLKDAMELICIPFLETM
jgi:arginyl-tRNA synthetase